MSKWNWPDKFETERLYIYKSQNFRDLAMLKKHLKEDGDFYIFTGLPEDKKNIDLFDLELEDGDYYSLYDKSNGEMIGYIAFSRVDETTREIEFYIFKAKRSKSYCEEGCRELINYVFTTEFTKTITATVTSENIIAQQFLRKLGFKEIPVIAWQLLSLDGKEYSQSLSIKVFRIEKGDFDKKWQCAKFNV